jgi:hypothetical protein
MSTESVRNNNNNSTSSPNGSGAVPSNGPLVKLRVRINPGDHNLAIAVDANGTVQTLKQVVVREVEEVIISLLCCLLI